MGSIASKLDHNPRQLSSDVVVALADSERHQLRNTPSSALIDLKRGGVERESGVEGGKRTTEKPSSRRGPIEIRPSGFHAAKERKQPLALIKKNLSPVHTNKDRRMDSERHADQSNPSVSDANKENINNFATQARSFGEEQQFRQRQHREPLQTVPSNSGIASSAQRLQKKLRPVKGGKRGDVASRARSANDEEVAMETPVTNKVPVDPPGTVLGALPWMPPNEGFGPNNMYQRHGNPSFNAMANWAFQPVPNVGHAHGWTVPPFLAPLSAAVRHPFANLMAHQNAQQNGHFPPYYGNCQPDANQHCAPMEAEETCTAFSSITTQEAVAALKDDTDTKMADSEPSAVDLPSTFAPMECVERIRSRRLIESCADLVTQKDATPPKTKHSMAVQSRVMTRSATKAMKKSAAHQASSPVASRENCNAFDLTQSKTVSREAASPPPEIMTVLGKKVTMIDPVRKVFVIDLLTPAQCDEIRMMADNHTLQVHESGSSTQVWRTLYTYTKMDLPVCEVPNMREKYTDRILLDVKRIVGEIFDKKKEALTLRPRSWKEPHMLLYQALDGKPHHTGIEMHYDGCDITWQAMLTRNDEYEGGGTYFRCLRKTVLLKQGQVLVHPGELYHKGLDITYGVRCLLVCFTDGFSPKILDDSKAENDDPKYESNVYLYD